jgi:hypothetical protein
MSDPTAITLTVDDRPTPLCDFCSSTEPTWLYPCADFDIDDLNGSDGDWLACAPCAAAVELGRTHGMVVLAQRVIDHVWPEGPPSAEDLLEIGLFLWRLHGGFFDHRTGPRRPIEPGDLGGHRAPTHTHRG